MKAIEQLAGIRSMIERLVSGLDDDALFRVPPGYVNSIAWNAAHVIATQQILQYRLSGIEPVVPSELIEIFKKGTGPEECNRETFDAMFAWLHPTVRQLQEDYGTGRFTAFTTYETSTGIVLHDIDEAITFDNMHEGIHIGYILAMKRALG